MNIFQKINQISCSRMMYLYSVSLANMMMVLAALALCISSCAQPKVASGQHNFSAPMMTAAEVASASHSIF